MQNTASFKKLALKPLIPELPHRKMEQTLYKGRTIDPQLQHPKVRLQTYNRRQVSMNLSTQRSLNHSNGKINSKQGSSAKKKVVHPKPIIQLFEQGKARAQTNLSLSNLQSYNNQSKNIGSQKGIYNDNEYNDQSINNSKIKAEQQQSVQKNEDQQKQQKQDIKQKIDEQQKQVKQDIEDKQDKQQKQEKQNQNQGKAEVQNEQKQADQKQEVDEKDEPQSKQQQSKKQMNDQQGGYQDGSQNIDNSAQSQAQSVKFKNFSNDKNDQQIKNHYYPQRQQQLRMEKKYLQNRVKQLRQLRQDRDMIEQLNKYKIKKSRLDQNSMRKIQQKRIKTIQNPNQYNFKKNKNIISQMQQQIPQLRKQKSFSLPIIKNNKIIDAQNTKPFVTSNKYDKQTPKLDDILKLKNQYSTLLKINQKSETNQQFLQKNRLKALSINKYSNLQQVKLRSQLQQELLVLKKVQDTFRKKGISFQINNLKRGLIYHQQMKELNQFPQSILISNPMYKRLGL